jgi:biotin--protein ligase
MPRKLNILLYNGTGVCSFQKPLLSALQLQLSNSYDIIYANEEKLLNEPWEDNCALIVFPGGTDLPYLRSLAPKGTSRIKNYVNNGGSYLGKEFIIKIRNLCRSLFR